MPAGAYYEKHFIHMPKEVRITRGLDSMGALRPDGSGSVLMGKRKGDLLTAIKVLPVTIHSRSQLYDHFQAAAERLKRINLEPNPNLVKVLNYGISEIGSHPFIESEFIDGPDLDELLEPPYDPVFTLFEVLKVADHLANALAQCHQAGVVHGSIKPANIRFNMQSADYVLVGFGLSTLTPKQLKGIKLQETPFTAPELLGGQLAFSSDVYSYGVILYRLLSGTTPFLRVDGAGTDSYMRAISVLIDSRRENLPESWTTEQKEREMRIPAWLPELITSCLHMNPEDRFFSGVSLQEALVQHSMEGTDGDAIPSVMLQQENDRLRSLIIHNKELAADKEEEVARLKALISHREEQLNALKYQMGTILPEKSGIGLSKVILAVLLVGMLGAAGSYIYLNQQQRDGLMASADPGAVPADPSDSKVSENVLPASTEIKDTESVATEDVATKNLAAENVGKKVDNDAADGVMPEATAPKSQTVPLKKPEPEPKRKPETRPVNQRRRETKPPVARQEEKEEDEIVYEPEPQPYRPKYTLGSSQAFFYSRPEENARRNLVLVPSDNTELVAVEDSNGFIYVSFFDAEGKTVRGWLRKQDLRRLN
jgi:eukaryotic-like serine/threonine-protein kinase